MSTKAIREALNHLEAIDTGSEAPLAAAARAELERIEEACRVLHSRDSDEDKWRAAHGVIGAIAKQPPRQ